MSQARTEFQLNTALKVKDEKTKENVIKVADVYLQSFDQAISQFSHPELARQRAAYSKWKALEDLDKYLIEFESNFTRRGGKVIWMQDAIETVNEISAILSQAETRQVVKTKSMVSEEIGLSKTLESNGINTIETDLGEYIQQKNGEGPFHIVTPAMHKSREEITAQFSEEGLNPDAGPEEITSFVRHKLRERFIQANAGISGANFLVADTGSVSITENEGNGLLGFSYPKIHIVVAGIEKIIPGLSDLENFLSLLATYGTGQKLTAFNSLVSGPRLPEEEDGPEEMYVILLDNNRSVLLEQTDQRQALSCIKCGACSNVCPVFHQIGGHAYGSPYNGPIGSVITPFLKGPKEYGHLSQASSLCGRCTEYCPVNIPIHKMLLYNRRDLVEKYGDAGKSEKWSFFVWKKAMLKRSNMNQGSKTKNFLLESFFKKTWGADRELPKVASKSFNEWWKEEHAEIFKKS